MDHRIVKLLTPKLATIAKARPIAEKYSIVIWLEDGQYFGRSIELPNVMSDGATPGECHANTLGALIVAIAFLIESGETVPEPAEKSGELEVPADAKVDYAKIRESKGRS
jgi:predicted RNase H-like HicB family nuclease